MSKVYQALTDFIKCLDDAELKWRTAPQMMDEQLEGFKKVYNVRRPQDVSNLMYSLAVCLTKPAEEPDYPAINFIETE